MDQSTNNQILQTPLHASHLSRGGKMVDFAGWSMPVQFQGLKEEHHHVRTQIGLFDVSHMGEIRVKGERALETLQWLTTNDVSKLQAGQAQYSLFPNDEGGIVDDLIVYCLRPNEDYLLCVNAANQKKDFAYLLKHNRGADIVDESSQWGQIAIQGPLAMEKMKAWWGDLMTNCPSFEFREWNYKGDLCWVARTGYTGEDGVEIFVPWDKTADLWNEILDKVPEAQPIGLGARDTLRTEMKYPLYGQDIDDHTSPYAAGLGWVVKPQKGHFLGSAKMIEVKTHGPARKSVGLLIKDAGIARPHYKVFSIDSREIGVVTSGTLSPSLNKAIAIAYLDTDRAELGAEVLVQMRNKMLKAEVVKTPFYRPR